jgi:hypothetical protein
MLSVVMLSVVMLSVMAPFEALYGNKINWLPSGLAAILDYTEHTSLGQAR